MKNFDLSITAEVGKQYVPYLRRHLRNAHDVLRPALSELSVALVGDRRMSQLHEQFIGITGPTDVLTFPLETDRRGQATAGEVVVCVPEASRRAADHKISVQRELLLYAIHGMLHLAGFDDRTPSAYRKMHSKEDHILKKIGVGATFSINSDAEPESRRENQKPRKKSRGAR